LRFALLDSKTFSTSLWEVSADGGNLHQFLPGWNAPASLCCGNWTADGKYFVFQSSINWTTNIWAIREPAGSQSKSEPALLINGPMDFWYPAPSRDGRRIYVVGVKRRGELARYDAKTQRFESYLPNVSAEHLDFSRDGEWVAYVTYPEGDLWRSKVNGSERLQLSFPPMRAKLPRWSPNGKRIAFSAEIPAVDPGKPLKTYIVSAEGGTPPQELTAEERIEKDPGWSPDGKMLVFGITTDTKTIHLINLNTREVTKLPGSEGMYSPRWSPDGRYIIALSSDTQRTMLFDRTLVKWDVVATTGAGWPHWSQDGKYIYFSDSKALFRLRIADRQIERLAAFKDLRLASGSSGPWIGWAPDDSPLVLRDTGIQDIYALEWQTP
jgi:Tol biopolymer transport system component